MNKNALAISFYPTDKCNFSCKYCYRKNNKFKEEASIQQLDTMFKNLSNYTIESFTIFGGEPSLYRHINYLIDGIIEKLQCYKITIFTNGSNKNFLIDLSKNKYINYIQVRISCHLEYYEAIKENLLDTYNLFPNITTTNLIDATNRNKFYQYIEDCIYYNWKYYVTPIIDDNNNYKNSVYWNESFANELKEKYNITYTNNFKHKFLLQKCYNNFMIINPDGSTQYTHCHYNIKNTNIFQNNWLHKNQYIICKNPFGINCSTKCNNSYHEKN